MKAKYFILYIQLIVLGLIASPSRSSEVSDKEIRGAVILNVIRFISWPSETFESEKSPFVICVLGENPFGSSFVDLTKGKLANGRSIKVDPLSDMERIQNCQAVYVTTTETWKLRKMMTLLRGKAVLVIGESDRFAEKWGMIGLVPKNKGIGFEINLGEAEQARLKISAQLLRLAKIVQSSASRGEP